MKPCISQATTLSTSFEDDLTAYSRAGWPAVEIWLTKLETYLQAHPVAEVKAMLQDRGLEALDRQCGIDEADGGSLRRLEPDRFKDEFGRASAADE